MEIDNHVCMNLYERYGWKPIVASDSIENPTANEVEETETKHYTEEELTELKAGEIKKIGTELGYTITAVKQTDCIKQFLAQQG